MSAPRVVASRRLTVVVRRRREGRALVAGFEVFDFLDCENLVKLHPNATLEEGRARLAEEKLEVAVAGKGLPPEVFLELVRDAMSLTGVRRLREFYARLKLPQPLEPTPELDKLLSSLKSVKRLPTAVG